VFFPKEVPDDESRENFPELFSGIVSPRPARSAHGPKKRRKFIADKYLRILMGFAVLRPWNIILILVSAALDTPPRSGRCGEPSTQAASYQILGRPTSESLPRRLPEYLGRGGRQETLGHLAANSPRQG
jgi:hypothetical protein